MAIWQYPNNTGTIAFVVVDGEKVASRRDGEMISFKAEGTQQMGVYRLQGHDETSEPVLEEVPVDSGRVDEKCLWIVDG